MPEKVKLELRPYDALAMLCFVKEFINEKNKNDNRFAAIHETVDNYEKEIYKKLSSQQLEDAILENRVNDIAGRHPK